MTFALIECAGGQRELVAVIQEAGGSWLPDANRRLVRTTLRWFPWQGKEPACDLCAKGCPRSGSLHRLTHDNGSTYFLGCTDAPCDACPEHCPGGDL